MANEKRKKTLQRFKVSHHQSFQFRAGFWYMLVNLLKLIIAIAK